MAREARRRGRFYRELAVSERDWAQRVRPDVVGFALATARRYDAAAARFDRIADTLERKLEAAAEVPR